MDLVLSLLTSKALMVPIGAWLLTQAIKIAIASVQAKQMKWSRFFTMGGMPSSHSTLVSAVATTVAVVEGVDSPLFAVAVIFAGVVIHDAAGVRQTVSEQSVMLNRILDELLKGKPAFEQRLRGLIGHSVLQVIAGTLLGIAFSLIALLVF